MEPKTGFYFAPGEIMLTVEHAAALSTEELTQNIQDNFDTFLAQMASGYSGLIQPEAIVTLPTGGEVSRSLVFVAVSHLREKHISDGDFDVAAAHQQISELIEAAFSFLFDGETATPFISNEVTLMKVSPNWHSTISQPGLDPTGGPGAQPLAVVNGQQAGYRFQFEQPTAAGVPNYAVDYIRALAKCPSGVDVDVVILDTAPSREPHELLNDNDFANHPLIQSLCQPGRLQIYRYDTDVAPNANGRMARLNGDQYGIGIEGHDYYMRDHGLFIAGIIHSIAPNARLHLVQVLNDYGVGTLDTIGNGIAFTLKQIPWESSPLIVNCSLTIQMPLPEKSIVKNGESQVFHAHPSPLLNWAKLLESLFANWLEHAIRDVFDNLFGDVSLLVAAAGNDQMPMAARPQPRLPAQFSEVIGVTALNHDKSSAPYANIADAPEDDGFETFGGNVSLLDPRVADEDHGILGVYTELMDGTTKNDSGWGRWAGTSFATPIIVGVLALLRADGKSQADARQVLKDAQQEARPPEKPQQFLVTQG